VSDEPNGHDDDRTPVDVVLPLPAWLTIAQGELGVHELPGSTDNPRVLEYLATVGMRHEHDECPWCSAFVNWCLVTAGFAGTHRPNARSWLNYGLPLSLFGPEIGSVAVFSRPPDPAHGHVAFFLAFSGSEGVLVRGGNQGNRVCDAIYPRERLLGFRRPVRSSPP